MLIWFAIILATASIASASWKEKVLYGFQGGTDGQTPAGGVVFDKAGNLYGATVDGGADNCSPMAACGTVFQLQPPAEKGEACAEDDAAARQCPIDKSECAQKFIRTQTPQPGKSNT